MPNIVAVLATGAISIYGLLYLFLIFTQDKREPPLVSSSVPFIGSMISLGRKKSKYYVELKDKHKLPIYTLRLPFTRLYVINSLPLITAVQRQFHTLAFPPLEAKLASSVCGISKEANDILMTNVNGEDGHWGYSITFYKMLHGPLSPGKDLDAMNRVMVRKVEESISSLMEWVKGEGKVKVKLFEFVRREITLATTDSVYGPENPFKNPEIGEAFWKFQPGIITLIMGLPPSIFARESLEAREFMTKAFTKYFKDGSHNDGSAMIKARFEHSTEHKIPLEDIARFEVGGAIGILTNTSPTSFWMIYHLYSSPAALEDCRQELQKIIVESTATTDAGKKIKTRTIDLSHVKNSCPILLSTLQEVLRLHTIGISTRLVMEDHLLSNKYLLKAGNTVMIPGPVQHTSVESWGPTVGIFDHRRFLPENKTHNATAFRGFGGGTTLCPGRHFASTEILAFTALLILRFDVRPVGGVWKVLTTEKAAMWETTPVPDEDVEVEITRREEEEEGVKWMILVSDSDKAMPLSAEDE